MHALAGFCQQGGGFPHKIDAAKNNVGRVNAGNAAGKLQRISGDVAVAHHVIILVVVPHYTQIRAKLFFQGCDCSACVLHFRFLSRQYEKRSGKCGNLFR